MSKNSSENNFRILLAKSVSANLFQLYFVNLIESWLDKKLKWLGSLAVKARNLSLSYGPRS